MMLALVLTSCQSLRESRRSDGVIPDPIAEDGTVLVNFYAEGETVEMPYNAVVMPDWYWKKIARYIIDTAE